MELYVGTQTIPEHLAAQRPRDPSSSQNLSETWGLGFKVYGGFAAYRSPKLHTVLFYELYLLASGQ